MKALKKGQGSERIRLIVLDRFKMVRTGLGSDPTIEYVYSFNLDRFRSSDGLLGSSDALRAAAV